MDLGPIHWVVPFFYFFYFLENSIKKPQLSSFFYMSNPNGNCQKWGVKCHFTNLNSVLPSMNSVFAPMIGAKI